MTFLRIIFVVLLVSSCGGVQAGNPVGPGRYSLTGKVLSLEGNDPLQRTVRVVGNGLDLDTESDAVGEYLFDELPPGAYVLSVDDRQRETVVVQGDTIKDVILPVPAAPRNFRLVEIGVLNGFCLLWDDVSGVEAGFRIEGPVQFSAPSNRIGVLQPIGIPDVNDRDGLEARAAAAWNADFPGTYYLTAYNEYGDSTAVPLVVYGYSPDDVFLDLTAMPDEQWSADQRMCLATEVQNGKPTYLEIP